MTEDYEPRFGEVWQWDDMGPYMILGLSPLIGYVNVVALTEFDGRGRLISLVWDYPGKTFREHWLRIDTEELGA